MTAVVVVCGVGGVGKTTCAAALAVRGARDGLRTCVLTIDPARRLADALGIESLGNEPRPVHLPDGTTLDALMLDRKATWDQLVRDHADDRDVAGRLLANRYYEALSTRLSGGHEYMATEKLHALAGSGRYDLVVVDTPPSQHVADVLEAPARIRRLLDRSWLQALLTPQTGLVGLATRRVADVVRRLAGTDVISDLEAFFGLVGGLAERLRAHGAEVDALLRAPTTSFVVVTAAQAPRLDELDGLMAVLEPLGQRVRAVVLNRAVPPLPVTVEAAVAAIPSAPQDVAHDAWDAVRDALADAVRRRGRRAEADAATAEALGRRVRTPVWPLPELAAGAGTGEALLALAAALPPTDVRRPPPRAP